MFRVNVYHLKPADAKDDPIVVSLRNNFVANSARTASEVAEVKVFYFEDFKAKWVADFYEAIRPKQMQGGKEEALPRATFVSDMISAKGKYAESSGKRDEAVVKSMERGEFMFAAVYSQYNAAQNTFSSTASLCVPYLKGRDTPHSKCSRSILGLRIELMFAEIEEHANLLFLGCDLTKAGSNELYSLEQKIAKKLDRAAHTKYEALDYKILKDEAVGESDQFTQNKYHSFLFGNLGNQGILCAKTPGSSTFYHRISDTLSYRSANDNFALMPERLSQIGRFGNYVGREIGTFGSETSKTLQKSVRFLKNRSVNIDAQVDLCTFSLHSFTKQANSPYYEKVPFSRKSSSTTYTRPSSQGSPSQQYLPLNISSHGYQRALQRVYRETNALNTTCKIHFEENAAESDEEFAVRFLREISSPSTHMLNLVFGPTDSRIFTRSEGEFGQSEKQIGYWWTDAEQRKNLGDDADVLEDDVVLFDAKQHKKYRILRAVPAKMHNLSIIFCVDMYSAYLVLQGSRNDKASPTNSLIQRFKATEFGAEFMRFALVFKASNGTMIDIAQNYPLLTANIFCVKYQDHQFQTKCYFDGDEEPPFRPRERSIGVSSWDMLLFRSLDGDEENINMLIEDSPSLEAPFSYIKDWLGGGISEGTFILDPSRTLIVVEDKRNVRLQRKITDFFQPNGKKRRIATTSSGAIHFDFCLQSQ